MNAQAQEPVQYRQHQRKDVTLCSRGHRERTEGLVDDVEGGDAVDKAIGTSLPDEEVEVSVAEHGG
jgi:hypothetical protein